MFNNSSLPIKTVYIDRNSSTEVLEQQYEGIYAMLRLANFNTTHPVARGLWDSLTEIETELRIREYEAAEWVLGWD